MGLCSGKMNCTNDATAYESCRYLVARLKDHASFIVGFNKNDTELTHSQSMKIRCGGLLGMHRLLHMKSNTTPVIPDVITLAKQHYNDVDNFPYSEIIQDIKTFNHRKKRH